MNFFTKHRVLEAQVELLRKLCEEKDKRITILERQTEELKALFSKSSQFEIVEQGEDRLTLKMKDVKPPTSSVRSGYRAKQAVASAQTHTRENDSVAQLEKRAAEEN